MKNEIKVGDSVKFEWHGKVLEGTIIHISKDGITIKDVEQ